MKKKLESLLRLRNIFILFGFACIGITILGGLLLLPGQPQEPAPFTPTANPNFQILTPTPGAQITLAAPLTAQDASATALYISAQPSQTPPPLTDNPLTPSPTFDPSTATPYPLLYNDKGQSIPVTWGDYEGPTTWPSVDIPPPLGLLPIPDDQVNILLLGNDFRKKHGARTDTIMLLTLNPSTGTASITSFPRDLYVYAPGWSMMKINTIQPRGGYDLLKLTFEYNFGVRPDNYVNITRDTFVKVVNSIGGIDVMVDEPLSDPTFAAGKYSVGVGMTHMDGAMARWYASSRNTSSIYHRDRRQQAVLKAIFLKILSLNGLQRIPELYNTYQSEVYSDVGINDIIPLAPLAGVVADTSRISQHAINEDHVEVFRTPVTNAYVLIPDQLAVFQIMLEALLQ